MSLGPAPIRSATCYRDTRKSSRCISLSVGPNGSLTLDHRPSGWVDVTPGRRHAIAYLPRLLDCLLGLPSVSVRPRVRVSVLVGQVGQHGIEYPRIDWRRRLHVEVDRSSYILSDCTDSLVHRTVVDGRHHHRLRSVRLHIFRFQWLTRRSGSLADDRRQRSRCVVNTGLGAAARECRSRWGLG